MVTTTPMRAWRTLALLSLLVPGGVVAAEPFQEVHDPIWRLEYNKTTLTNVFLIKVGERDGIVKTDSGLIRIPLANLPDDLSRKYWLPKVEKAQEAQRKLDQRLASAKQESEEADKAAALASADENRRAAAEQKLRSQHEANNTMVAWIAGAVGVVVLLYGLNRYGQARPTRPPIIRPDPVPDDTPVRCPRCASSQVATAAKGFGVGKAAVGAVLLGPLGLVAGLSGAKRVQLTCLKCGAVFFPGGN